MSEKQNEECGYIGITVIALCIALISAILTLLIASYMYHGVHDHVEMPAEIVASTLKRLLVPHKKVIIIKNEVKNRCYILPIQLAKEISTSKFSSLNIPLTRSTLLDVAGDDGVDFCASTPAYILEKSSI